MTFVESIKAVLTNYAGFTGRASRSEFWWFFLFTVIVSAIFSTLSGGNSSNFFGILGAVANIALLVPSLAVGVRRLQDIGRSGWYLLFAFIPLVGIIILIVWFARAGDPSDNAFGTAPTIPARPAAS
jgi:uncharacterized membrane protein YhaH (DUF805 family)